MDSNIQVGTTPSGLKFYDKNGDNIRQRGEDLVSPITTTPNSVFKTEQSVLNPKKDASPASPFNTYESLASSVSRTDTIKQENQTSDSNSFAHFVPQENPDSLNNQNQSLASVLIARTNAMNTVSRNYQPIINSFGFDGNSSPYGATYDQYSSQILSLMGRIYQPTSNITPPLTEQPSQNHASVDGGTPKNPPKKSSNLGASNKGTDNSDSVKPVDKKTPKKANGLPTVTVNIKDNKRSLFKDTSDGKNDGKISLGNMVRNFLRGVKKAPLDILKFIKENPVKSVLMMAAVGGAILAAPAMIAAGGAIALAGTALSYVVPALAAAGVAYGVYKVCTGIDKALTATTDAEAKQAYQNMGYGTSTIAMSSLGFKPVRTGIAGIGTKALNGFKSTKTVIAARGAKAIEGLRNLFRPKLTPEQVEIANTLNAGGNSRMAKPTYYDKTPSPSKERKYSEAQYIAKLRELRAKQQTLQSAEIQAKAPTQVDSEILEQANKIKGNLELLVKLKEKLVTLS